ncbi:MAG TPA: hypothetical protein VGB84_07090 [Arachidicoccus sp.]
MQIKIKLLAASLLCFAISSFCQHSVLDKYKTCFDSELKEWTVSFQNFDLDKFAPSYTAGINNVQPINTNDSDFIKYVDLLRPVLSFCDDKQKFVDIYHYEMNLAKGRSKIAPDNSGEQQIILYDLQAGTENKILLCGMTKQIQEVVWMSDTKLILAGREIEAKKKVHPLIYVVDLDKHQSAMYQTKDDHCIETTQYTSPKLRNLNYQSE